MEIKPDEISSILRQRIEGMETGTADLAEVGTVLSIADGIARVHGLDNCMSLEMLELPHDVVGLALNLEEDNVGTVLFGEWDEIVEGDRVKRTGRLLDIPVGEALLGRLVDPLGQGLHERLRDVRELQRRHVGIPQVQHPRGELEYLDFERVARFGLCDCNRTGEDVHAEIAFA